MKYFLFSESCSSVIQPSSYMDIALPRFPSNLMARYEADQLCISQDMQRWNTGIMKKCSCDVSAGSWRGLSIYLRTYFTASMSQSMAWLYYIVYHVIALCILHCGSVLGEGKDWWIERRVKDTGGKEQEEKVSRKNNGVNELSEESGR